MMSGLPSPFTSAVVTELGDGPAPIVTGAANKPLPVLNRMLVLFEPWFVTMISVLWSPLISAAATEYVPGPVGYVT